MKKQKFIDKWSLYWMLLKDANQVTEEFTTDLDAVINAENEVEKIKLTPEIYETVPEEQKLKLDIFYWSYDNCFYFRYCFDLTKKLEFVHEYKDLYKGLTGEELEINCK